MFPHLLTVPRDARQAGKERAPHRLAAAAAAAAPDAALPLSPRSPTARLAAAAASGGSSLGSPRARAAALPAYRALLGRQAQQRLPHVQHAGERLPAGYTSLDGLRKLGKLPLAGCFSSDMPPASWQMPAFCCRRPPPTPSPLPAAELHTGKHSQVCSFLDTRSGQLVAVKTYYKRTMAKRHYRNVRREIAIARLLAKQRCVGSAAAGRVAGCCRLSLAAAVSCQ